jgi:FlaA1/EpsC-like NDP-sugar epimerase
MGREIKQCSSEEEAKQLAANLSDADPYPAFFFASNTSGEKLYEEFYTDDDALDMESHESLGVIKNAKQISLQEVEACISDIRSELAKENYSKEEIVRVMKKYLPDFQHIETGKTLDSKM